MGLEIFTNQLNGPGRAIGCVSVCVCARFLERHDYQPRYVACSFTFIYLMSINSEVKVKVIVHSS